MVWARNEAHSVAYAKAVRGRLKTATSKEEAESALAEIEQILEPGGKGASAL